jgi:hypothetical protein|tara:strand:- start:202 stop:483 length:282 start_codon:yes stop_codon:yes gene_type:complete
MATIKRLEQRAQLLNKMCGFKGFKYVRLKNGKLKSSGSGFTIGQAYGGVRLEFMTKKGGSRDVSPRLSKAKLDEYIGGMIRGIDYYKDRARLK